MISDGLVGVSQLTIRGKTELQMQNPASDKSCFYTIYVT